MYQKDIMAGIITLVASILFFKYFNGLWFDLVADLLKPYAGELRSRYFQWMFAAIGAVIGSMISLGVRLKGDWDRVVVRIMSGPIILVVMSLIYGVVIFTHLLIGIAAAFLLFCGIQHILGSYKEQDT